MNKIRVGLYLILAFTLLVRIFALGWDLPYTQTHDEYHTVGTALNLLTPDGAEMLLREPDVNPVVDGFFEKTGYFNLDVWTGYPPLTTYIQAFAYKVYYGFGRLLGWFRSINELTTVQIFLIGRFIIALFGTGTVFLVYLIGTRMYSRRVGLISALFLAFSFLHISCSRIIKPDVLMVFFGCLSFLFAYLIYERGKITDYLLAAIFLAFSVATKYTTVFLLLPILLAHLLGSLNRRRGALAILLDKKLLILFAFMAGGFFLANPYGTLKYWRILEWLKSAYRSLRGGELGRPKLNEIEVSSWLFFLRAGLSGRMGWPLGLCSLAGVIYGIWRHKKKDILLLCFPFVFFAFIGTLAHQNDSYILPIFPFVVILAARFLVEVTSRFMRSKRAQNFVIASFASGILLIPGIGITRYLQIISQEETRIEAKKWIEANIPSGSRMALESYCPPLSSQKYHLYQPPSLGTTGFDWYRKRKFDYIIMSSYMYDRYLTTRAESLIYRKRNYEDIVENCELIKKFDGPWFFLYNPNPVIKIYTLDYQHPYLKFPQNFARYAQTVSLEQVEGRWVLKGEVFYTEPIREDEDVGSSYVKLVDSKGKEIAKLLLGKKERNEEERLFISEQNSITLASLPANYRVYIGYEYGYSSDQGRRPPKGNPFKEFNLDFGGRMEYPRKEYRIHFFYEQLPLAHFAEYGQMVALFQSKNETILWSQILGGELFAGDDYVLNPYVGVSDGEGKEIARLLVHQGKVGSFKSSVRGTRENSISLSTIPAGYKVHVGYQYYHDNSHRDSAGGPLEIELSTIGNFQKD